MKSVVRSARASDALPTVAYFPSATVILSPVFGALPPVAYLYFLHLRSTIDGMDTNTGWSPYALIRPWRTSSYADASRSCDSPGPDSDALGENAVSSSVSALSACDPSQ